MKLANLKLNPDNPRNIKPEKLEKLAQSIKDFPKMMVKRPIVYDENKVIIGGNMRYRAIQKLGMDEIPDEWTSDASDFTPEERKRFIMQDNAEMGEHDYDMVANQYELEDLDAWGIDVPYADTNEEVEEDEAPEVSSEPPVSQSGSIYQLGRHRVMCGDSTDFEAIMDLLEGAEPDSIVTDPPYGIGIDGQKKSMNKNPKHNRKEHEFRNWDKERPSEKQFEIIDELGLKTVIWGGNYFADMLPATRGWLYWDKGQNGLTMSDGELAWTNQSKPLRAVTCNRANLGETQHPTQKPVQVMQFSLDYIDAKVCLDLFLGSGSTLIACEQTDRTCYGMELDPKYVDVIRKRYWKFVNGDESGWEAVTPAIKGE